MADTHKCRTCDRQIYGGHRYCAFCRSKLKKAGICVWCGEKPIVKGSRCEPCQAGMESHLDVVALAQHAAKDANPIPAAKYRDSGAKENTRETKHGRD
jgi:predicted amidophosphoribosyltransferase